MSEGSDGRGARCASWATLVSMTHKVACTLIVMSSMHGNGWISDELRLHNADIEKKMTCLLQTNT